MATKHLLDPRGQQRREELNLALRPSLEKLKEGPILFYNNTKLDSNHYIEVFNTIKERFQQLGISNFVDVRETVRGKTPLDLRHLAQELAGQGFVAAITALGDIGVSPATTILTIELEKAGIPTAYITAPPGSRLAEAVALYRAGRLCLCEIDIYQASTKEEVEKEIGGKIDYLLKCLTASQERIGEYAAISLQLDTPPPCGTLVLPGTAREEPGALMDEMMDLFEDLHIGDGLPCVPPTEERYQKMLKYCPFPEEEVLATEIGPSGKDITIHDLVVAAVMAGCKPEYLPILITAFRAMADPKYNLLQSVTTSHPGGNLVLVSGPLAQEIGIHGGQGCLGPGFRANATIGRAVNLVIINTCRAVPGMADLDCLASQAQYSYCFGEDPALSPWPLMNEERFNQETTTVYVLKAEPPHDVIEFLTHSAKDLLESFVDSATTLGSNNAYIPGALIIVLTPDHAKILAKDGWDKSRIRRFIHEKVRWPREKVIGRGIAPVRPPGFREMAFIPVTRCPEDVEIVVAGERGGHSAVILPWALHSSPIVEPVRLPNGKIAKKIEEFSRI